MSPSSYLRIFAVALVTIAFDAVVRPPPAVAEIPAIASRQRAEKKAFTDSEIIDGFLKTAFGAEYHLAGRVDRIRKYTMPVRVFADVILTVDNGDFVFFDCAYEELLQSLGPINDTSSVPWTMFNDKVSMGFFDVYDQYILNILYDPRVKAGMNVEEVKAVLPEVLADVRVWVRKVNELPE